MDAHQPTLSFFRRKRLDLKASFVILAGAAALAGGVSTGCRRGDKAPPLSAASAGGTMAVAPAEEVPGPESAAAHLVPKSVAVSPGNPFTLEVELQAPAGWHTYWEHPGETGLAPSFTWTLPEGIRPPQLHLPVPHWFDDDGIVSFGYEGNVRFLVEFETDAALAEGTLQLDSELLWMICKDMCLPVQSPLSTTLVVSKEAPAPAETETSALWRSRLPRGTQDWAISAKVDDERLRFRITPKGAGAPEDQDWSKLRFFPLKNGGIDLAALPVWSKEDSSWQAVLAPGMQPYAPGDTFEAVIASGEQDDWKGWRISVTVE